MVCAMGVYGWKWLSWFPGDCGCLDLVSCFLSLMCLVLDFGLLVKCRFWKWSAAGIFVEGCEGLCKGDLKGWSVMIGIQVWCCVRSCVMVWLCRLISLLWCFSSPMVCAFLINMAWGAVPEKKQEDVLMLYLCRLNMIGFTEPFCSNLEGQNAGC